MDNFTRREFTCLLKLRRKPRKWAFLKKKLKVNDDSLNMMLSRLSRLYYVKDDKPATEGIITLNQIGETVAQAEFDRRFDMYFTRAMSGAALIVSAISAVISAVK